MSMHYAHGVRQAGVLRGSPACLPEGYREALAAAPSMPLVDVERANVLALTGSLCEARAIGDTVCGLLPFPAEHPAWPALLVQMVNLIRLFGDAATAGIAYRQLLPFRPYPGALGSSTVWFMGTISRHLGELAEISGDREMAIGLLREALPRNQALGARPDLALTSLDLARLLRDGGQAERAEAAALARDALDIAGQPGHARHGSRGPAAGGTGLGAGRARRRSTDRPGTRGRRPAHAGAVQPGDRRPAGLVGADCGVTRPQHPGEDPVREPYRVRGRSGTRHEHESRQGQGRIAARRPSFLRPRRPSTPGSARRRSSGYPQLPPQPASEDKDISKAAKFTASAAACGPDPHADVEGDRTLNS